MEKANVELGKHVDNICKTINGLVDEGKTRRKQGHQPSSSIYRVPEILRKVNPYSYCPRLVSIGPFHREDENLKELEAHKMAYLSDIFHRLRSSPEEKMKECVSKVFLKIGLIKSCYIGKMKKEYYDEEFANMIVIDGCFIIELIYRSYKRYNQGDLVFDIKWLSLYVKHDLILLENQIPFFVLQDIFDCTIKDFEPAACLSTLLLLFLQDMNPFHNKLLHNFDKADTNHEHILALVQKCYQPMGTDKSYDPQDPSTPKPLSAAELPNTVSYSATDLSMAGVHFEKNEDTDSLLAMEFKLSWSSWYCWFLSKPTFTMPFLQIEDYTEAVLRNLIAYEQLTSEISNHITSYAFAMESLLDSKEDVWKLVDSKVVVNNLGSSKDASDMFNRICKEVTVKDFSYSNQWRDVEKYYQSSWPRNIAYIRGTYFNNPWSFIGLVAAVLLFALTVVETYFTVYPPN